MWFQSRRCLLQRFLNLFSMADNYLEKKMEALQARKAKEARARQIAWKKRMDAYRKRLEEEAAAAAAASGKAEH